MTSALSALSNRNYRLYFVGQLISMSGTFMQSTVLAWLVYRIGNTALWLGVITICLQLPAFLASPLAGVFADRKDRRKLLLWVETIGMLQAFGLAGLIYFGHIKLWHIAILSVILGLVTSFELTTRHAFAVDLVGKSELSSALSLNSVTINGSRILGPAFAGIFVNLIGEGWCFLLNGFTYLAVIAGLLAMTFQKPPLIHKIHAHPIKQVQDALQHIRAIPTISRLMIIAAFISLVGLPYATLLPVFARDILHGDATTLSWLMGISGVGAIVGAFSVNFFSRKSLENTILIYVAFMGVALATLGVSNHLWLSLFSCFAIGFFMMGVFPSINNAIQQIVEDSMRGRVLSLYTMTFLGAAPIGSLIAGWSADQIGARNVAVISAGICLVFAVGFNYCSKKPRTT